MEAWGPFIQLGVGGVLLLVLFLVVRGELRTTQEVSTWKERTNRAEGQVDKLLPAVEQNTETLKGVVQELHALGIVSKELLVELHERRQPLLDLIDEIRRLRAAGRGSRTGTTGS